MPTLPAGYELLRGDVRSLPFPDASFEVAAAAYLLHLFDEESLRRTLAEARRVLVPGGWLVTVTPVAPRSFLARPWTAFANTSARLLPFALGGLRLLDPRTALEEAGFVVRRMVYVPAGYPSLCVLSENRRNTHARRVIPHAGIVPVERVTGEMPTETIVYRVPGMTCGHCKSAVEGEVGSVAGVESVDVDLDTKLVAVRGENLRDQELRAAIDEAGYEAD